MRQPTSDCTDKGAMRAWLLPAWLPVLAASGCLPDTHLVDEGRGRTPGGAADGKAPTAGPEPPAPGPDTQPAALEVTLSLAADCARIRVQASEPVHAEVQFQLGGAGQDGGEPALKRVLGEGASLFDQAFRLTGLPPMVNASVRVIAIDRAGHTTRAEAPAFRVPVPPQLPLVLTEVLANPAGPETSQEYVELVNQGPAPVALDGLSIEDDAGRDPLPALELPAGARALVVGNSFVEVSPGDVPPRPGTPLARVAGRIGRDGLRQAGETVRLVAADGLVLSSYGGWVDTSRPAWNGRSVHRQPDETACDHPQAWSMVPAPPTPGW